MPTVTTPTHPPSQFYTAGGGHSGCVVVDRKHASVVFDMVASLPPSRLCKESWPLLDADKRWRRSALRNLPSAVSGVHSDGRPGEVDENVLASAVSAAADAYAAIPDAFANLSPFRSALFHCTFQQRIDGMDKMITDCLENSGNCPPTAVPSITAAGNRGAAGRGSAASATSRRNSATRRTQRGRGCAAQPDVAQQSSAASTNDPSIQQTISTLLTCPLQKKDDGKLVAAIYEILVAGAAALGSDNGQLSDAKDDAIEAIVERELGHLVHLSAASRGPKFHQHAHSVMQVFAILGAFMQFALRTDTIRDDRPLAVAAGAFVLSIFRVSQRAFCELPRETKAEPELWFGRVVGPMLHLIPFLRWQPEHLPHIAAVLRSCSLPDAIEDEGDATQPPEASTSIVHTNTAINQRASPRQLDATTPRCADDEEGGAMPQGWEQIYFDEHIQIDNKPTSEASLSVAHNGPTGSRLRQRSAPAATAPPPPPPPTSWSAFVVMPYAHRISVTVHTATRCETLKVCLIPDDTSSCGVTADALAAAGRNEEEEEDQEGGERTLESPVTTECLTGITARSAHTLCEPGSVFVRCVGASPFCHFQASVVGSIRLLLDVTWLSEVRAALTHASLWVADKLLEAPPPTAPGLAGICSIASGGRREDQSRRPLADVVLCEPDASITRRLRCRLSDAPKLRLIAAIATHCAVPAASTTVDTLFQCEAWNDIAKRCALYSEKLSNVSIEDASALVRTLVGATNSPRQLMAVSAALEAATELLVNGISSKDLLKLLENRRLTATHWVAGLTSLTTTASQLQLKDMHHVARVLRWWMRGGSETAQRNESTPAAPQHYLQRIVGCGEQLSHDVRQATHRLMSYLFQSLSVAIRRMVTSSTRSHPHRYVVADTEDGTLMMLTLSLLTAPLDTKDVAFMSQSRIAEQLLEVMPNFTEFSRTNSFRIDEENEAGMATLLQTLVDQWQSFGALQPVTQQRHRSRRPPTSTAASLLVDSSNAQRNSFAHAQRGGQNGAWMITSGSRCQWHVSRLPVLDTTSLSDDARGGTSAPFPFVEVAVKSGAVGGSRSSTFNSPSSSTPVYVIALIAADPDAPSADARSTNSITSARSMPEPTDCPGSFFLRFDGALTVTDVDGAHVTTMPWVSIQDDDVIGLGCTFNARTQRRELHLWLNGIRLAVVTLVAPLLFLGVGTSDRRAGGGSSASQTAVEVTFSPSDVHERVWHQTCLEGLGKSLLLPTPHEVSLYASHAYLVLMSRCARLVTKWRRADHSAAPPVSPVAPMSPLSTGVPGTYSGFQQHALHALVEGGTERLCSNMEAVVGVLEELPVHAAADSSPSARLKVLAARHVYHSILLYWVGTLRVLSRICGFSTATVDALSKLVACENTDPNLRITTMQLLCTALDDASLLSQAPGLVPPAALWDVCLRHSAQTTASVYQPRFNERTIGPKLSIEEGGKGVGAVGHHRHSSTKNSAYAVPSVPLLSTVRPTECAQHHLLGGGDSDTVCFSVRMTRQGRSSGTLGRYYFVGMIGYQPNPANSIFTDYMRSIGDRCFLLPDYASEAPSHVNKGELERYRRNWLTPSEGNNESAVIFGSGDMITISIHTRRRTIAFQRNSLPLGVLFQDIKAEVTELFPMVCLYNGDATAAFQMRPSELGIRSRVLVRQLLRAWPDAFAPKLLSLIDERDPVAMRVLQSDGSDFAVLQRAGAEQSKTGGGTAAPRYQLVRLVGDHIEVLDAEGRHRLLPADSVVQDYASSTTPFYEIAADVPPAAAQIVIGWRDRFVGRLIDVVAGSVMDDGEGCVCVLTPRVAIRALRLLCQLPFSTVASSCDTNTLEDLTSTLLLLARMEHVNASTNAPDVKSAIQAAWVELDALDEHQAVFHVRSGTADDMSDEGRSNDATPDGDDTGVALHCARCGSIWGTCTHPAPLTQCEMLDAVLSREHIPSPYTGWAGSWSDATLEWQLAPHRSSDLSTKEEDVSVASRTEVVGSGEDQRGRFSVSGVILDGFQLSGTLHYQAYDRDGGESPIDAEAAQEPQEWTCDACTLINPLSSTRCGVCGSGRPGSCWACQGCTYAFNSVDAVNCMMCGTRRVVEDRRPAESASHKARCIVCRNTKTFSSFEDFQKIQECSTCHIRTRWVPEEPFTATVKACLTTKGDQLDMFIRIGHPTATTNASVTWHTLKSHSYTYDVLRSALREGCPASHCKKFGRLVEPLPTIPLKNILEAHKADLKRVTGGPSRISAVLPAALGLSSSMLEGDHDAVLRMLSARLGFAVESVVGGGSPTGSPTSEAAQLDCTESAVRSAVQMLASKALLSWLPGLVKGHVWSVEAAGAAVATLQHAEDEWFTTWDATLDDSAKDGLLSSTLSALHSWQKRHTARDGCAAALGTVALYLLSSTPSLQPERMNQLKSSLIAGLSQMCATWRSGPRERMLQALLKCFEAFQGDQRINASPVLKLLSQEPALLCQQRLAIFAALHSVESGHRQSAVTAAKWVTHAVHQMSTTRPLAQFFDGFHPDQAPHLVVLPDTKLNDGGDLMVGQVRGSVAVHPNRGGKYYYEVVLPPNYADRLKVIVMGWGSKLHEIQGSSQHVGSDFHSWGYNGRNRVRLLTGEQEIPVPHNTAPGDIIGALLDLDRKQMCWSLNGKLLQWVDIPLQGDGEPIYPYVSASVEPHVVTVCLNETQYLPEGFTDFRCNLDDPAQREPSTAAPPQSLMFYKELTSMANELSTSGLRVEQLVLEGNTSESATSLDQSCHAEEVQPSSAGSTTQYVERAKALLPQYPLLCNYVIGDPVPSGDNEAYQEQKEAALRLLTQRALDERIVPYLRHLCCLNAMATVVAKRTDLIRQSPFLWGLYHQAKDLLFFSARWALVDIHLSRRLNRSGDRRALVLSVDRHKALNVADAKRAHPPTSQAPLPSSLVDDLLRQSVLGQMFHGMLGKEVYTYLTMFTVQLQDNITEDAGGVTRSMLSFMCDELMWSYSSSTSSEEGGGEQRKVEPVVPLFSLSDHSTYFNLVPNMKWLPSLNAEQEALAMQIYEWLGKMLGNAVLAGTLVYSLNFPRIVWKFLSREEATIEDFYADCSDSDRGAINDDAFLLSDDDYYRLPGVVRQQQQRESDSFFEEDEFGGARSCQAMEVAAPEVDVAEGTPTSPTASAPVPPSAATQRLVQHRRRTATHGLLHQYDSVLERMRCGFESVVPTAAIDQMRWDDVRQRVSGSDGVTAADILANMDMTSLPDEMQRRLVQVVNTLPAQGRSALLLFATGQRRLPVPEKIRVTCGDDPNELPTAHTCSPISMMVQPYRTVTEFMEKLSLSLAHVYEFGFV